MDFKQFCNTCADEGLEVALDALGPCEDLWPLADACAVEGQQADARGDQAKAARLFHAADHLRFLQQYRLYLEFPYD